MNGSFSAWKRVASLICRFNELPSEDLPRIAGGVYRVVVSFKRTRVHVSIPCVVIMLMSRESRLQGSATAELITKIHDISEDMSI